MPVLGQGIIPACGAIAAELSAVVRRAFMNKVYVQIWKSAPLIWRCSPLRRSPRAVYRPLPRRCRARPWCRANGWITRAASSSPA